MFANSACVRLAHISVSHSYNLRRCRADRSQRVVFDRTPTRQVGIAERRKPDPQGQPGYLRAARLAKAPQGRHPPRDAPAASQPPQRHGSGPADAESQARPASPLSTSSLIPSDFCSDGSRARGLQTPAPLPPIPIPAAELPQKGEPQRHRPSDPPSSGSFLDWKMLGGPVAGSYNSSIFKYSRNLVPNSSWRRANSTVAWRNPSLSPAS